MIWNAIVSSYRCIDGAEESILSESWDCCITSNLQATQEMKLVVFHSTLRSGGIFPLIESETQERHYFLDRNLSLWFVLTILKCSIPFAPFVHLIFITNFDHLSRDKAILRWKIVFRSKFCIGRRSEFPRPDTSNCSSCLEIFNSQLLELHHFTVVCCALSEILLHVWHLYFNSLFAPIKFSQFVCKRELQCIKTQCALQFAVSYCTYVECAFWYYHWSLYCAHFRALRCSPCWTPQSPRLLAEEFFPPLFLFFSLLSFSQLGDLKFSHIKHWNKTKKRLKLLLAYCRAYCTNQLRWPIQWSMGENTLPRLSKNFKVISQRCAKFNFTLWYGPHLYSSTNENMKYFTIWLCGQKSNSRLESSFKSFWIRANRTNDSTFWYHRVANNFSHMSCCRSL